ncbi:MAG: hypothetical protein RLY16_2985 [Bacteroidota bacterium]|jgi:PKD repeat protein
MRFTMVFLVGCLLGCLNGIFAQPIYSAANYASNGDTFYLTKAQISIQNFDTSGAGIEWDYSTLESVSQRRYYFRAPNLTGFTLAQWPYIFNSNNVNVSATDEQSVAVFGLQQTNPNDYFLNTNNLFRQKASAYTLIVGDVSMNVRNVYTKPDTLIKFPIQYLSTNQAVAAYTISVANIYFRDVRISRRDTTVGWGVVKTPAGTYQNALQVVSWIQQIDSIAVNGTALISNDTSYQRQITWYDVSKKYPVLQVKQLKSGNMYLTNDIYYLDQQQFFQPQANFAFIPVQPFMGDTVNFQNLCTNATQYLWDFGDGSATSTLLNPTHQYVNPGNYFVRLIAYNGNLTDTITLPLTILPRNQVYTFIGNGSWQNPNNWSQNQVPPQSLPATNQILIQHIPSGKCILDVNQRIEQGASFTVLTGMNLLIQGGLHIQQ